MCRFSHSVPTPCCHSAVQSGQSSTFHILVMACWYFAAASSVTRGRWMWHQPQEPSMREDASNPLPPGRLCHGRATLCFPAPISASCRGRGPMELCSPYNSVFVTTVNELASEWAHYASGCCPTIPALCKGLIPSPLSLPTPNSFAYHIHWISPSKLLLAMLFNSIYFSGDCIMGQETMLHMQ